jgi:hypothetical protein
MKLENVKEQAAALIGDWNESDRAAAEHRLAMALLNAYDAGFSEALVQVTAKVDADMAKRVSES